MIVSDRVMKMKSGAPAWVDNSVEDKGRLDKLRNAGLVYDEGTIWGSKAFPNLPQLSNSIGPYNIGDASTMDWGGDECISDADGFQCQGTTTRRYAATFGGTEGHGSVDDVIASLRLDPNVISDALADVDLRASFRDRQNNLSDKQGNFIKDKYRKLNYPTEDMSAEDAASIYGGRYGAWHLKSLLLNSGQGSLLWENKGDGVNYDASSLKDLRVGDLVTLTRSNSTNDYDEHVIPGYASEDGVTHVGMIVGEENGVPIIEHSWSDSNGQHHTEREALDSMKLHIPSSIIRYNKSSDNQSPAITPATETTATIAATPEYDTLTSFKMPSKFESIVDLNNYLEGESGIKSRLSGLSLRGDGAMPYAVLDLSEYGYDFTNANTDIWSLERQETREDDAALAQRQAEREARIGERSYEREEKKRKRKAARADKNTNIIEEDTTPILKSGGIIYRR